jgi:hypothetical protein
VVYKKKTGRTDFVGDWLPKGVPICHITTYMRAYIQSAHQEKIPARNAIYEHAQDFSAGDELLLAILKAFIPLPLNKQQTIGFHVF